MKLYWAAWQALFGILLTFIVGVIIWAVAGPVTAILIFAGVVAFLFWAISRNKKTPPHPGG